MCVFFIFNLYQSPWWFLHRVFFFSFVFAIVQQQAIPSIYLFVCWYFSFFHWMFYVVLSIWFHFLYYMSWAIFSFSSDLKNIAKENINNRKKKCKKIEKTHEKQEKKKLIPHRNIYFLQTSFIYHINTYIFTIGFVFLCYIFNFTQCVM